MAEEFGVFHEFISSIPDDPTFVGSVQPQAHWNHYHILKGGNPGDVPVRDVNQLQGFSWSSVVNAITGRLLAVTQGSDQALNNPSPSRDMAVTTFNVAKTTSTILIFTQASLFDNGPVNVYRNGGCFVLLDGVSLVTFNISALFTPTMTLTVRQNLTVGAHQLKGTFTATTGQVNNALLSFVVVELG